MLQPFLHLFQVANSAKEGVQEVKALGEVLQRCKEAQRCNPSKVLNLGFVVSLKNYFFIWCIECLSGQPEKPLQDVYCEGF